MGVNNIFLIYIPSLPDTILYTYTNNIKRFDFEGCGATDIIQSLLEVIEK